ncbi:hypothetical protein FRC11_010239 [Ceratobasidium sp. 423]|nr:hypothetical protein FRC11_010239 [Ceratobasidium sp. 423]
MKGAADWRFLILDILTQPAGQAAVVPRKRQRTQKQSAPRKRGRLADFVMLPVDVFTVIASYLAPLDILSLARSNKFFRTLLMTKSSRNIWLNSMKNVKGLPPCPSGVSEPQYVALLFTNMCTACGTLSRGQVDEILLVRFCTACKNEEIMKLHELPEELHELVPYSTRTMGFYDDFPELHRFIGVALRDEANAIWERYNELIEDEDETLFKAWAEQQKRRVAVRRKSEALSSPLHRQHAGELSKFLNALDAKRGDEKRELLKTRRAQVKERLLALGWEAGDLKFNPYSDGAREWHELVEMPKQPKPLTDRIWKNLYAKLQPLLEVNREERLEQERLKRKVHRRNCLDAFLRKIERQEPPLIKVKPRPFSAWYLGSFYRPLFQRDVFPFARDALELPFVQALNDEDEDLSVEDFRRGLEEHRSEVGTYIVEWRDETRARLVDLLRDQNREYTELLQPPKNTDPDVFAKLSDDQKLLLRADSLFYVDQAHPSTARRPYPYDKALRIAYTNYAKYPAEPWELEGDPEPELTDLDLIHRHAAAQEVARDLLEDLGRPNASFVEVNQLHYICERCHDKKPKEWTGIIEHYLEQKQIYAKVEKHSFALAQEGIIYNNVHGPGDKPLVRLSKPNNSPGVQVQVRKCSLCAKKPIVQSIVVSQEKLYKHLLEVHGVTEPKLGVHYHVPGSISIWDQPGTGYDYEDEAETEIEEVEADNEPEKEEEMEGQYGYGGYGSDEEEDGSEDSE